MRQHNKINLSDIFQYELSIILISILSGLLSVSKYFNSSTLELTNFNDRTIGACISMGIDPNLRTRIFISMIFIFICVFFAVFLMTSVLNYLNLKKYSWQFSIEKSAISILSGVGITNFFLHALTKNSTYQSTLYFILFIIALIFLYLFSKILFAGTKKKLSLYLNDYSILAISFILPYQLLIGYWCYFEKKMPFDWSFLLSFASIWLFFQILYLLIISTIGSKKSSTLSAFNNAIVRAGIPLSFLPCALPIANEVQFTSAKLYSFNPRDIATVMIIGLFLLCLSLFIYYLRKADIKPHSNIISKVYYPIIIATNVLLAHYTHNLKFSKLDIFHTGEAAVPLQQIFKFNQIPYIDFILPHGLFDIIPQIFYRLTNGESGFEIFLWGEGYMTGWFPSIIAYMLFYALLKKLTNPLFSLLMIVCTPFFLIFSTYYSLFILPGLCIYSALKRPSFINYGYIWITILFLFLWRVDYGLAVLPAAIFILAGEGWTRHSFQLKKIFLAFFLIFGTATGIFFLILIINNKSILEHLSRISQYSAYQIPVASHVTIVKEHGLLPMLQYFILPCISVCYIIFYILKVFINKQSFTPTRSLLTFIAIISLVISLRSLHRHSLFEGGFNPYLFVFLICFIPFFFNLINKYKSMWIFLCISTCFCMIIISNIPSSVPQTLRKSATNQPKSPIVSINRPPFKFKKWYNEDVRVIINDWSNDNVVHFLNKNMNSKQTFFDFSNAPLLYSLSGRKYPTYILESVYHTSERVQKRVLVDLETSHRNQELPFVIFKQNNHYDHIDNVPNEIRAYRIAEFIYKNYFPLKKIDNYEIWGDKNLFKQNREGYSQKFNLDKLPHIWGTFDKLDPVSNAQILYDFNHYMPISIDYRDNLNLNFNPNIDKSSGNYLYLRVKSKSDGNVTVSYGVNPKSSFNFSLVSSNRFEDYLIRISSQWIWMSQPVFSISLSSDKLITIEKARMLKGD